MHLSPPLLRPLLRAAVAAAAYATTLDAQPGAEPSAGAVEARIDSLAARFLHDAPAVGFTLAVVRGGDTIALRGYGEADREARRPAGPATVYRVGSVTKQFTAAAALQLVEQGRLALDDTLGAHLPRYPRWAAVTIRQLLNHTSGIPVFNRSPAWLRRRTEALPVDSVLGIVAGDDLRFAPGTRWEYNNSGYLLLGLVIERVTGTPFAEHLRTRFFEPLGMRSAGYCANVPTAPSEARGYTPSPSGLAPAPVVDIATFAGAGALCMNVPDFLRWQAALTGGRVVSAATYAAMSRSDTLASGRPTGHGWGLIPQLSVGRRVIAHGGDIDGFSAAQLWLPEDSIRVVVFTNTFGSGPNGLADNIGRVARGLPPRARAAGAVAAELRAAVVGTYDLRVSTGTTLPITLWSAGQQLMAQVRAPSQQAFALTDLGDGTFGTPIVPSLRLRVVVENGRGVRAELRQNGVTFTGDRAP